MYKKKVVKKVASKIKIEKVAIANVDDSAGKSVISKAGGYIYEGEKNLNPEMGVGKNIHQNGTVSE